MRPIPVIPVDEDKITMNWLNLFNVIRTYLQFLIKPPRGEMYATRVSQSTTIPVSNTAYEVIGGFSSGNYNVDVSFPSTYYLQISKSGVYYITISASVETNSVGDEVEVGYMIDGVEQNNGTSSTVVSTANKANCIASSCVADLTANNKISLFVKNKTNTNNVVLEYGSLVLHFIGNK